MKRAQIGFLSPRGMWFNAELAVYFRRRAISPSQAARQAGSSGASRVNFAVQAIQLPPHGIERIMRGKHEPASREHSRRSERMADLIRQELGQLLEREVKDPRIGFTTITSVTLSGDLRLARVYVTVLGGGERKQEAIAGLNAANAFLRHQLAQRLNLRYTPEIEFHLDRSQEYSERIDELIRRTKTT